MAATVVNCHPELHLKSVTVTTAVWNSGLREPDLLIFQEIAAVQIFT